MYAPVCENDESSEIDFLKLRLYDGVVQVKQVGLSEKKKQKRGRVLLPI